MGSASRLSFPSRSQPLRKIGVVAAGTALALTLTGCHKDTEADDSSAAPVQQSALNKSIHQPAIAKSDAPPAKAAPAADPVPVQRDGEENVSPPVSSPPGKTAPIAHVTRKPTAAVKSDTPPVDLKTLSLPKIDPKGSVTLEPGITIGEPKPDHNDAQLVAFGAGCARWLNYAVGGLPEMGRTPIWASATRFETRSKRPNYQLVPQDAPALYNILGVTHAVIGQISGDAAHCVLTYQVVSVPDGKTAGTPLTLTGTQEQVVAGLPQLGMDIAKAVGVRATVSLPSVGTNGSDFAALGGLPWTAEANLTPQQTQAARDLASRLAPAGLLLTSTPLMNDADAQRQTVQTLLQQGKENGFALAEIAIEVRGAPREVADAITQAAVKYPNNYLYIAAGTRLMRVMGDLQAERKAITRGTRVAPHNVNAWLRLATTLGEISSSLRRGRPANMLSRSEWRSLNSLYSDQLQAAQKATEIDPQNGGAWLAVARAGTFASEQQLAEAAYWKSVELDRTDVEVHAWGLQMFQQKWGGSPTDLQKVADIAADAPLKTMAARRRIAEDLKEAGCEAQATSLYTKMEGEAEAAVAHDPNDAQAHYDLAVCYDAIKLDAKATREYKTVVALHPNDSRSL